MVPSSSSATPSPSSASVTFRRKLCPSSASFWILPLVLTLLAHLSITSATLAQQRDDASGLAASPFGRDLALHPSYPAAPANPLYFLFPTLMEQRPFGGIADEGETDQQEMIGAGGAKPKRAQTFVRFGKRAQTFVRFGKRAQTFVRFGRDAQRQHQWMADEQKQPEKH